MKSAIHLTPRPKWHSYPVFLVVLILCFNNLCLSGQEKTDKPKKVKKEKPLPENIEAFNKQYLIRPRLVLPTVWFDVTSRFKGKGNHFQLKPALPVIIGASVKIKKVYVSAAFKLPSSERVKHKYGDSKTRNINLNIQGRTLLWTLFYRDYKSFYLTDHQQYYPEWNSDSLGYPRAPNLRVIEAGLNLGINFNKNFSMNAAFAQGERQKRSAGSFLMGFSERYQRIESDSNIVPPGQGAFYPSLDRLEYGNFFSTILSLGAGYQFVMGKVHFTPVLMGGSGLQLQSYQQVSKHKFRVNLPIYGNFRTQLGYNGDHFFANVIYQLELNSVPIRESRIRLFHNWLEFGAGVRF